MFGYYQVGRFDLTSCLDITTNIISKDRFLRVKKIQLTALMLKPERDIHKLEGLGAPLAQVHGTCATPRDLKDHRFQSTLLVY